MNDLAQLEENLRKNFKFWQYETRILPGMTDKQKIDIAEQVLAAPKQWAQGVVQEFKLRNYSSESDE